MQNRKSAAAVMAQWIISATSVHAAILSAEAFDNATVQPGGPRAGSNGKAFFNVEGEMNGSFASYAVADFNFGPQPHSVGFNSWPILTLTQANASFSLDGYVYILLDTNPMPVSIQAGASPLAFAPPGYGTYVDESEGDLVLDFLFGFPGPEFYFYPFATGAVDTYSIFLTPQQSTAILERINTGSNIRIVIVPAQPWVAATWAGSTQITWPGPTLTLDLVQVPEPTIIVLASCCGIFRLERRNRSTE
jgi:hypothetical protein